MTTRILITEVLSTDKTLNNRLSNLLNKISLEYSLTYLDEITINMVGMRKNKNVKTKDDFINWLETKNKIENKLCKTCIYQINSLSLHHGN